MGWGEVEDLVAGEAGAVDGGEDGGVGEAGVVVGINDPEGAVASEVFFEGFEALELAFGFYAEEDEVGVSGGAVLGGVGYLREDVAEEGGVPNPE